MKTILLLASLCIFNSTTLFGATVKTFTLAFYALSSEAELCKQRIAKDADELRNQTGAVIVSTGCTVDDIDKDYLEGSITFSSEQPIDKYALDHEVYLGAESFVTYPNKQECLKDLDGQVDLFKKYTGLTPFSFYCFRALGESSHYAVNVIAVGKSAMHFRVLSAEIYGTIIAEPTAFYAHLNTRLAALPLNVAQVAVNNDFYWLKLRIGIYREDTQIFLLNNADITYEKAETCLKDQEKYQQNFYDFDPQVLSVFCTRTDGVAGIRLNIASLSADIFEEIFSHEKLNGNHKTRALCEAEGEKVGKILQDQGYKVMATPCALESGLFQLHAYFK